MEPKNTNNHGHVKKNLTETDSKLACSDFLNSILNLQGKIKLFFKMNSSDNLKYLQLNL